MPTPAGDVEVRLVGSGSPVTVFAHGLGAGIDETRAIATGVSGTRAFLHFRAHGTSPDPGGPWSYADLADQLEAVADAVSATQALGVSMGAGALLHLAARTPDRFERLVFFLPSVLDRPRDAPSQARLAHAAALAGSARVEELTELVLDDQAPAARDLPTVRPWARTQAERLALTPAGTALQGLAQEVAVADRADLAAVTCPCLVIAQGGDGTHPLAIARELCEVLPDAVLETFPDGSAMALSRPRLRAMITGFLLPG